VIEIARLGPTSKMRLPILPFLALLLAIGAAGEEEEEEENYGNEDADVNEASGDGETNVYVMEHGFLASQKKEDWTPRGTLLLSGAPGHGFEARLSDAKEFVQQRPELQPLMSQAASQNHYYAIRMYSPEKPKRVLQASIPAKLLADHFEDWHDILEVTVGSTGAPVSLSYRVRNTLGLALFDHTQVHIAEPSRSEGPLVHTSARSEHGGSGGGPAGSKGSEPPPPGGLMGFLRKYWWVVIIVLLLVSSAGGGDEPAKGGGGKK